MPGPVTGALDVLEYLQGRLLVALDCLAVSFRPEFCRKEELPYDLLESIVPDIATLLIRAGLSRKMQ